MFELSLIVETWIYMFLLILAGLKDSLPFVYLFAIIVLLKVWQIAQVS